MKKETIKTILLVFSVLLTFVLVFQVWFSSYFIPGGYDTLISALQNNIIRPVAKFFSQGGHADFSHNLKILLEPEQIVVNQSGDRRIYRNGQKDYDKIKALSEQVMSDFILGNYTLKSKEIVTEDAYFSALKGKSVFVDYGMNCDYRLFSAALCGKSQSKLSEDLQSIGQYILSLQDGILSDIAIFVTDKVSGNVYRYLVEVNKSEIAAEIDDLLKTEPVSAPPSYSFELNFHKEQPETDTKILFDPLVLMDLMPVSVSALTSTTLEEFDRTVDQDMLDTVLRTFSINTRTMHRYVDLSDARVFVENNATLTLYPNGLLEYQTVGGGRGLEISSGSASYDIYQATTDAVNFVTDLCSYMPPEYFDQLRIRTDLIEDSAKPGFYRICFDYCIDGMPALHKSAEGLSHAIELEIENGYLKSYRQYMKLYKKSGSEPVSLMPMLNAADSLVDEFYDGTAPLSVQKIHICYIEDEETAVLPVWYATVNGREKVVSQRTVY